MLYVTGGNLGDPSEKTPNGVSNLVDNIFGGIAAEQVSISIHESPNVPVLKKTPAAVFDKHGCGTTRV